MLTIWIFALLGLAVAFLYTRFAKKTSASSERVPPKMDKFVVFVMKAACGPALGALVGAFVALFVSTHFSTHLVPVEETALVSLRNSDTVSGSFFLGTGTVNGRECYVFFKVVGSGFELAKLNAEAGVTVHEEDRGDGQLVRLETAFVDPQAHYWAMLGEPETRYAFYVPRGSIRRNFNLN